MATLQERESAAVGNAVTTASPRRFDLTNPEGMIPANSTSSLTLATGDPPATLAERVDVNRMVGNIAPHLVELHRRGWRRNP